MLTSLKDTEKLETASKEHEPDQGEIIPYVLVQHGAKKKLD
jgi:hypothetical protein